MQHKLLRSLESLLASHFLRLKKKKRPKVGFGFEGLSKLPENRDYLPHFRKRKLKKRPPGSRFYLDCFFVEIEIPGFDSKIQKLYQLASQPLCLNCHSIFTMHCSCNTLLLPVLLFHRRESMGNFSLLLTASDPNFCNCILVLQLEEV